MAWEVMPWQFMYDYFGNTVDNLNDMYNTAIGMFSAINPFNLSGAIVGGSFSAADQLKNLMSNISDIVAGVAIQLCVLFFLIEFFRKSMDLQWVKWENVLMFLLKLIFAKILIENSMAIMEWVYTVFNDLALRVNTALGVAGSGFLNARPKSEDPMRSDCWNYFLSADEIAFYRDDGGLWGLSRVLKVVELSPAVFLAQGIMLVTGAVVFARVFEVMVYTMVAPIPLSSFSSEEHRQIGIGFIKSYAAVCLQALIIVVMFAAFAALSNELTHLSGTYASGAWGILLRVILLGMGVFKSGSWAKKLCGAM